VIILNEFQNKLNEIWAGVIDFYEFNILKHTITFNITVIENGQKSKHFIVFKGVSSYHFYENSEEQRLNPVNPDEGDYLELTSIQFYKNGIGNITTKSQIEQWAEQYYSDANFVLEIWNSMLFIEASNLILNDVEYGVKYPNN
jgi:hypothetical protein